MSRLASSIIFALLLGISGLYADYGSLNCSDCCCFDGFYAGGGLGAAVNTAKTKVDMFSNIILIVESETDVPLALSNTIDDGIYETSPWGELFVGWGKQCSCLYLGGRFGINFSSFCPKVDSNVSLVGDSSGILDVDNFIIDSNLKTKLWCVEYTFDFKPGIVFCKRAMLFGIIGVAVNKERLMGRSIFTASSTIGIGSISNENQVDRDKTSAAFRGGLGVEYMFARCWSLQLNSVYTRYWKLRGSETAFFLFPGVNPNTHSSAFSTRASKYVASIGLTRYF
ncbi:MAG: hypothetical protein WAM28_05250 [Chlamydiales bacterium]